MNMTEKEIEVQVASRDGSLSPGRSLEALSAQEKQLSDDQIANDFPDGGVQAWSVAIGCSLIMFCTMGMMNCFGVFQAYYQTHQLSDKSPSTIAWIGSIQVFFMSATGLVGGPLFDRYGAKVGFTLIPDSNSVLTLLRSFVRPPCFMCLLS